MSSSWISFDNEINFLKKFFHDNGFPLNIIEDTINKFLNNKFIPHTRTSTQTTRKCYVKLPFYGHLSYSIRKRLNDLLRTHFTDTKFIFVFTNSLTIGSFFRYKDVIPTSLVSNVIYEFMCSSCKARYIGETRRNLTYRIAEHKGLSPRTNKQISNPSFSAVRAHAHELDHPFSKQDFRLLHRADSNTDTKLLEAIYIKHMNPELNNNLTHSHLHVVK